MKYDVSYVMKFAKGLSRHLQQPHKKVLITDRAMASDLFDEIWSIPVEDFKLLAIQGCFARLRMFDPWWQRWHKLDDRLVCIDLDVVFTGSLDPLFDRPEPFVILSGANSMNPCPYNGSLMMLRAGYHAEVWDDFSLDAASAIQFYQFPDDQGWLAHKVPHAATWKAGRSSGVYAFRKPGWPPLSDNCPADARLVAFPGTRDPSQYQHLSWVRDNWRA